MAAIGEHLVGRAETGGAFDDALADLRRGPTATLVLVGEPGIGKTRLLTELARRANAHGDLVLRGAASELADGDFALPPLLPSLTPVLFTNASLVVVADGGAATTIDLDFAVAPALVAFLNRPRVGSNVTSVRRKLALKVRPPSRLMAP